MHSWKQLSKGSRHLGKNFLFSLGARNTLALPLELEWNQVLIGFKIWTRTLPQSSVNQPYPVGVKWVLASHLPCELFWLGPLLDRKYLYSSFTSSYSSSWCCLSRELKKSKSLWREISNAFTNMPWGWMDLHVWELWTTFLYTWAMVSEKEESLFL